MGIVKCPSPRYLAVGMKACHIPRFIQAISFHLHTIFLFTKADIITVLVPVTFFAVAAAPLSQPTHLIRSFLWIWIHTLQANIANQVKSPDEDRINKPSRPIPSGRISVHDAIILRWVIVLLCLVYSFAFSTQLLLASIETQLVTILYNDLEGDKLWLSKNVLSAMLYGCGLFGGTIVAGRSASHIGHTGLLAVRLNTAVFVTTIHAQDFKDVDGDSIAGRRTLPILFPVASRIAVGLAIPLWSVQLSKIWDLDWISSTLFIAYSCFLGARFVLWRDVESDKWSCKYYSLWFSLHHLLPGYWHYFHGLDEQPKWGLLEEAFQMSLKWLKCSSVIF